MKKILGVTLLILGMIFSFSSTINRADELQEATPAIEISIIQNVERQGIAEDFRMAYHLSQINDYPKLDIQPSTFEVMNTKDQAKVHKVILRFGEGGIAFPQAGEYRLRFAPVYQGSSNILAKDAPTYLLNFTVNADLLITRAIIYREDNGKKVDELVYSFLMKGMLPPIDSSSSSSSSSSSGSSTTETTSESSTSTTESSSSQVPPVTSSTDGNKQPPKLPNTGNPISRVTNKVLKFLHLPQTGTKTATYLGLVGLALIVIAALRVAHYMKNRK